MASGVLVSPENPSQGRRVCAGASLRPASMAARSSASTPRPKGPHGGRQQGCRGAGSGLGAPLGQGCGRARGCQVWAWVFRISWGQEGACRTVLG